MSNSIIFAQVPRRRSARCTTAYSTFGTASTSGLTLLYAAGANGSILRRLKARPRYASGSTAFSATQAQLWAWDGLALWYDDDATIPTQTVGLTGGTSPADFGYGDGLTRYLENGWSWYVGIGVGWTPGVEFTADIGDL